MSDTGDSPGQVVDVPADLDPLDALEQLESGGQDATPNVGDAAATDPAAPASAEGDGQQPAPSDGQATDPGQDEWYMPGKFRTAEDMRESYLHLEQERGRLAQELGEHRQALAQQQYQQAPQPQYQQAPQPQMPVYQHPPQGYTQEQIDQLQYENPAQLADWFGQKHSERMVEQLIPALAPLMESVNQQEARQTVDSLRRTFGDDTVQRHSQALAAAIQADDGYFVDEQTRLHRLSTELRALEYDRLQREAQAQPRASDGTFAAKPAPVHVEGGSSGNAATPQAQPDVDPVVQGMRGVGMIHDRFGSVPPELARRRG